MPASEKVTYDGYFNCSPECWVVFEEVLGGASSNPAVFGEVHQMTIDAYAAQHAGGAHPDKSVVVHLVGLHATFVMGIPHLQVAPRLQRLAGRVQEWPHFRPPLVPAPLTILDVAMAETPAEHLQRVKLWAEEVWNSWADHHGAVARFVAAHGF
jgi:hypothetical protein